MSTPRRTRSQVLAGFDHALGLHEVPRPFAVGGGALSGAPVPQTVPQIAPQLAPQLAPHPSPISAGAPAPEVSTLHPASLCAPADRADKIRRLAEIRQRHADVCPHCTTATAHTQLVFGEGDPDAPIFFVGEAPGETEDQTGRPFVGAAGQKLDEMIRAMGFTREEVYIANVLKSRPPNNRTPLQHEIDACGPFLLEQLLTVRPQVIVTLGGPATKLLLAVGEGITRVRGIWHAWTPPANSDCAPIPAMPTYHPAYVLRTYTPKVRGEVWSDLRQVLDRIGRVPPSRA